MGHIDWNNSLRWVKRHVSLHACSTILFGKMFGDLRIEIDLDQLFELKCSAGLAFWNLFKKLKIWCKRCVRNEVNLSPTKEELISSLKWGYCFLCSYDTGTESMAVLKKLLTSSIFIEYLKGESRCILTLASNLQESAKFMQHSKRRKLVTGDIDNALHVQNIEVRCI